MSRLILIAVSSAISAFAPVAILAQETGVPGSTVADQLAESSLRMVGSMFVVLALVALCAWILRRWRDRQGSENGSIEIVSGITLGSKERIVLLRIGDEQILVGVSPAGMRSLHVVGQSLSREPGKPVAAKDSAVEPASAVPGDFRLSLGAAQ